MGMIKKGATATAVAEAPKEEKKAPAKLDSGTAAAVSRLSKKTTTETTAAPAVEKTEKKYAGRDFDKEARGKTRCVQFEAALMSPAIAGMKWDNIDEYLALVRKAADAGVAYTFGEEN